LLLHRGADVDSRCLGGVTPLHYTAWKGKIDMAAFLLDHCADIHAHDPQFGSTPLGWARFQRWPAVIGFLSARLTPR
jgi:ankyrin repeat protein